MLKIFGIVVVLILAALFTVLSFKNKKSNIFKWILILVFIAVGLTWVLPSGSFDTTGLFTENDALVRVGISDIPVIIHYAFYFTLTTVIFLLLLGGFYGIFSKSKSYQALVERFGAWIKKHDILATILIIFFVAGITSVLRIPFAVLMILPFITSSLLHAKFDKVTAVGMTYGAMTVGIMGATIGTDSLYWFNNYIDGMTITTGIWYRVVIFAIAVILFSIYNIYRVVKKVRTSKKNSLDSDLFAIEESQDSKSDKKKVSIIPAVVILILTLVFIILAYVGWANEPFKIEAFNKFHDFISEYSFFKIDGEKFPLISYILGSQTSQTAHHVAFGTNEITSLISYIIVLMPVIALMSNIKWTDALNAFGEGVKKMLKPTMAYVVAYMIFIVMYLSPISVTIMGTMTNWTDTMNPFITILTSFVGSIFHSDIGYTSYSLMYVLANYTQGQLTIAHTIFIAINGLVQLVLPVAGFTLIGLASFNVDYKNWLKYIWMFALAMLIVIVLVSVLGFYVII